MTKSFSVFFVGKTDGGERFRENLGKFESLKEARNEVALHPKYIKSNFTKRGKASPRNPEEGSRFYVIDGSGDMYTIY